VLGDFIAEEVVDFSHMAYGVLARSSFGSRWTI
jgi:hypothetical protein